MANYPSVPSATYPIKESKFYDIIVTDMFGKEIARARHTTPIRSWELNYESVTKGETKYIWDFFNARKGQLTQFTFVHPETAVSYTARFVDDKLSRKEVGADAFDFTLTLIQVI